MLEAGLYPIAAFMGVGVGIALSYIAPEELVAGRAYIESARKALFFFLLVSVAYGLKTKTWFFVIFSVLGLFLLVVNIRWPRLWMEMVNYLLILFFSILITEQRLLGASLLFLYGFPAGTLLRMAYENRKK